MRCFTILTTFLAAVTSAAAHGVVTAVVADGQTQPAWNPFVDPYASPVPTRVVRKVPNDGPVTDITNPNIACNQGGNDGTPDIFDVNAGSDMTFKWTNWPSDHLGPVTTLMASCNGDCSNFQATNGKWFKIDEAGYANGKWASQKLIADGNQWTSNIPTGLASGQYLVRYEIVALHSAGQPQYYPGCVQVNVKNGGADTPSSSELTTLPGMYTGFKWPDIWTDPLDGFVVAGPKVVSFAEGGSSDPSPTSSPSSSVHSSSVHSNYGSSYSTVSRPSSTSTPAMPASTSVCRTTKKRSNKRSVSARHLRRRSVHH